MAFLTSVTNALTKAFPKVLSPRAHAIADYVTIASFVMAAGLFWRRNKHAAIAAMVCGGTELTVNMLTDYPGGAEGLISFPMHGKIDLGLAAMIASMPEFMAFDDDREKKFFLTQAALVTTVANLSDFETNRRYRSSLQRRRAA